MNRKNEKYNEILLMVISIIITTIIYTSISFNNKDYYQQILMLIICNVFMQLCIMYIITRKSYYIFEPIVFSTFLYYMIFVLVPIKNIYEGNIYEFGINVIGGCIKGTIVFMLGYLSMLFGYYYRQNIKNNNIVNNIENVKIQKILKLSWILWSVGFIFFLVFMYSIGQSPLYMISFGKLGSGSLGKLNYSFGFMSQIIYLSFFPLLNIYNFGKNIKIKIILLLLTCVPLATRGFRNVFIILLSSFVVFYYIKQNKVISTKMIIYCLLTFLMIFGIIGTTRNYTRKGINVDMSNFKISSGYKGILYYFETYKCYYGAVEKYPSKYEYTKGRQLGYLFIMFIPRILWPQKPDAPNREVLSHATSEISAEAGSIMPNIGEYYTEFGILGTIIMMYIFGFMLKRMKYLYYNNNISYFMLYSLYLPSLVTIIPYGYTAGNFPPFIFMSIPLILQNIIIK